MTKLDRVLVHEAWIEEFTGSEVQFGGQCISDHCRAITKVDQMVKEKNPIKIFNQWTTSDEFYILVKEIWTRKVRGTLCLSLLQN